MHQLWLVQEVPRTKRCPRSIPCALSAPHPVNQSVDCQIPACRMYSYIFRLWKLFAPAKTKQKQHIGLVPSCKPTVLSECFPRMSDLAQEHCLLHIHSKATSLKHRRRVCHHFGEKGFEDCKTVLSRCHGWHPRNTSLDFLHTDYHVSVELHTCKMKSKRTKVYKPFYFLCLNTADHFLRRGQEKSSKRPVPV